ADYALSSDGYDLLVVDSDDSTELEFFVEHWDSAAREARVSINVPLLSPTPRTVYLYYGTATGTYTAPPIPSGDAPATFVESGWRMHTRNTTLDPTNEQEARSEFADIDDNISGFGCTAIDTLNGRNNRNTFSGPNGNFALLAETHFYVEVPGLWSFRMGSDFGLGGGLYVDGVALDERWNDDLWWALNWNNADVLVGSIFLQSGYHHIEALGYEGCCDGTVNVQYRSAASTVWRDLDNDNLPLYGRSCPPGVIDQTVTTTATPTFFSGSIFYDNGTGGIAHDGIRDNAESGAGNIDISATVVATGSTSSDQSNSNGEWSVCFLNEATGNNVKITATLPDHLLPVSEAAPTGNANAAINGEIELTNVSGTNHADIHFGVVEKPELNADRALQLSANQTGTLFHAYRATTAAELNFQISLTQQSPAMAFNYIAYRDNDCNGIVEQPPINLANPITVIAGDTICIAVEVTAGPLVDTTSLLDLQIDADTRLNGIDVVVSLSNTDTISGKPAGELVLDKRVCNTSTNVCGPVDGSNFGYNNIGIPGETLQY
ncbi:MAG: CCXG family PEP-CTERM protein, partial [Pseudomonadota bacterium]